MRGLLTAAYNILPDFAALVVAAFGVAALFVTDLFDKLKPWALRVALLPRSANHSASAGTAASPWNTAAVQGSAGLQRNNRISGH
jgi:hypothetical protein